MKIKEGFEIVNIADEYMAIPVGKNMTVFGGTVALNEVSAFILENMKTDKTEEELVSLLMNEYEVDIDTANKDVLNIISTFTDIGVIEK